MYNNEDNMLLVQRKSFINSSTVQQEIFKVK